MNFRTTIDPLIKWTISFRVFSIPFILLPYILGILTATRTDGYDLNLAVSMAGFIPLLLSHLAANLQSDIYDYRKGIDVVPNYFSGGIVRKWINARQAWTAVIVLYATAFLAGIILVFFTGIVLVPFLILGLLLSIFYSAGDKYAFKYNVTGEWFIFLGFGMMIPAYGYFLNAGHLSLTPVVIALPAAFLIAAVKHANNWIAVLTPGNLEKGTSAFLLGNAVSRIYYYLLVSIPYLLIGLFTFPDGGAGVGLPSSAFIIYISLPVMFMLFFRTGKVTHINTRKRVLGLDSITAVLYILFIGLYCISFFIG
jgi:1,4-dihydroxy-2-naphthoate octaprenyltransferase